MRGPGTNPRQSMMRSHNAASLLSSTGRTPLHRSVCNAVSISGILTTCYSSTRRGSIWSGPSIATAPSLNPAVKDPRPLRDRQYQAKMRQDILLYLQGSNAEVSMATLTNIQRKEYRAIFLFLVEELDPGYKSVEGTRFEDEFVPALKALRYPFAHQIDNKWLAAPASMHSWPSLLGVLHWLVELCKVCPHNRHQLGASTCQ